MDKKKRILFVAPLPPPTYGSALSSQNCLEILQSEELIEVRDIKVNYSESFQDVGKLSINKIIGFVIVLCRIIYTLLRFRPDLIYIMPATAGYAFFRDFFYAFLLKLSGKRIIYHLRTRITKEDRASGLKNLVYRKAFKNSCVIVLGDQLVSDVAPYFEKEDINILPNAIVRTLEDCEFQVCHKKRLTNSRLEILFLSNMMKEKGWEKLLDASMILKKKSVDFHVTFAGNWPSVEEEKEFLFLVSDKNLKENVDYIGFVDNDKKRGLLTNSNILVFPTVYKYETFGRVIVEAMEYGIPVIANSIASIPSIILDSKTGFLLTKNTGEEIAQHIMFLNSNLNKRNEMGILSRERFLNFYEMDNYRTKFLDIMLGTTYSK